MHTLRPVHLFHSVQLLYLHYRIKEVSQPGILFGDVLHFSLSEFTHLVCVNFALVHSSHAHKRDILFSQYEYFATFDPRT